MDCCIPNLERIGPEVPASSGIDASAAPQAASVNDSVQLEGEFLMGTRARERNRRDGEDPVCGIMVSPYSIAATTVTNREFAAFVEATEHVTEAERFGWSFVFHQFVSEEVAATVDQAVAKVPWWWKVDGAWWREPEGPGRPSRAEDPVVHVSWNDGVAGYCCSGRNRATDVSWGT